MLEFLMSASLGCENADAVIFRIKKYNGLPEEIRLELIEEVKRYEPDCYWDAKAN